MKKTQPDLQRLSDALDEALEAIDCEFDPKTDPALRLACLQFQKKVHDVVKSGIRLAEKFQQKS